MTRLLERRPLVTRVVVAYTFDPSAAGDSTTASREPYYICTIQLQAGEPVVVLEEESNVEASHELRLDAVKPTQGRYRGNSSTSVERGHGPDGRQYRPWHDRPPMDAVVDLNFSQPTACTKIDAWNLWNANSGWYWQLYDEKAPANADTRRLARPAD